MTFEKQILARIEKQRIKPTSRGYFAVRSAVLWVLVALSVIALGIGFGMIMFMLRSNDISLVSRLGLSTAKKILAAVPLFWIIITMLVGGIAYLNFRNTKKGYRVSAYYFGIIIIALGLAVGALAYNLNVTRYIDEAAADNIPLYSFMVPINTRTWFDPEHGLISGTVRSRDSNDQFKLRGQDDELWDIYGSNINMPENYQFHTGDRIKIVGTQTATTTFEATDIFPWKD